MKIQTAENAIAIPIITILIVAVCIVSVTTPCSLLANSDFQFMTSEDVVQNYNNLENELVRRFNLQIDTAGHELMSTVHAMGLIRSRKAIPLLLRNIDVCPGKTSKKSEFDPVLFVGASGMKTSMYPMFLALKEIGSISLNQCISELESSEKGTIRRHLFMQLGYQLHGRAFELEIQRRAASSAEKKKWEQLLRIMPPNTQEP